MGREAVDDLLEVLDRADVELHVEAVLARHAVALDDLGRALGDLGDRGDLAWRGAHAQHGGERVAERARVDLGGVARDGAVTFQTSEALGHRGGGEADAAAELGPADAGGRPELGEQSTVVSSSNPLTEGMLATIPWIIPSERRLDRRSCGERARPASLHRQ